jgi:flagellar hook-basal body complex protein FliE
MDIRATLAAQSYAGARGATAPQSPEASGVGAAGRAASAFAETLARAETTAHATMTGGADPHALVQALAETELAIQTAVTLRNKVVEAYQEILRMPV